MTENAKQKNQQSQYYDSFYRAGSDSSAGSVASRSKDYVVERFLAAALGPQTGKVLEIGCGDGFLTRHLLDRNLSVRGVDISQEGIRQAEARFAREIESGRLTLSRCDAAEFLKTVDDKYDAIVGSGIIHHIDRRDWTALFSVARESLKDGGALACGPEPNANGLYGFVWRRLAPLANRLFGLSYDWETEKGTLDMTFAKIRSSLESAGFSKVDIKPYQVIPHFRTRLLSALDRFLLERYTGRYPLYTMVIARKT